MNQNGSRTSREKRPRNRSSRLRTLTVLVNLPKIPRLSLGYTDQRTFFRMQKRIEYAQLHPVAPLDWNDVTDSAEWSNERRPPVAHPYTMDWTVVEMVPTV